MPYLLIVPILIYAVGDTLNAPLSLGPGLSLKNGTMYFLALILALRMAIRGGYKVELPTIQVCFVLLVAYAFISILVAGLLIRYDAYKIMDSAIVLKSTWIDYTVIFGLFFYGARSVKDSLFIMKAVVIAVTVANVISIASIEGFVNIPGVDTMLGEGGRMQGAFGGANGTAALVVCILPAYVAFAQASRGMWPLLWICGGLVSITMLLMTVSRGAMVAILIAYPLAAYNLRRYVSARQVLYCVGGLVILGAVAFAVVGPHFVTLFLERVVTESGASDLGALSSGRSDIWLRAIEKMMAYPVTLITGFGWNVYDTMGFFFVTHNYYLQLWFELGLVGLGSFVLLVWRTLSTVRAAVDRAPTQARGALMAFVFGFGAFLISLFFSNAGDQQWPYVWALVGVSLRMAIRALEHTGGRERDTARGPGRALAGGQMDTTERLAQWVEAPRSADSRRGSAATVAPECIRRQIAHIEARRARTASGIV
jgi:O-antigen ligase